MFLSHKMNSAGAMIAGVRDERSDHGALGAPPPGELTSESERGRAAMMCVLNTT